MKRVKKSRTSMRPIGPSTTAKNPMKMSSKPKAGAWQRLMRQDGVKLTAEASQKEKVSQAEGDRKKTGRCADCLKPGHWRGDPECEFVKDGRTPQFVPKSSSASSGTQRRPAATAEAHLVSAVETGEEEEPGAAGSDYWNFGATVPLAREAGTHTHTVRLLLTRSDELPKRKHPSQRRKRPQRWVKSQRRQLVLQSKQRSVLQQPRRMLFGISCSQQG